MRRRFTVGGANPRNKPLVGPKKVAPPIVPESSGASVCSSTPSHNRHSGSSFSSGVFSVDQRSSFSSSIGEDSQSNSTSSPNSPSKDSGFDPSMVESISSTLSNGSSISSSTSSSGSRPGSVLNNTGVSPSHYQKNNHFTFPNPAPQFSHLLNHNKGPGSPLKMHPDNVYHQNYIQQISLEDQGIDMQSPGGRSSPGSGSGSSASSVNCRNSTSSLDSGRASGSTSTQTHPHRLSGQSYESSTIVRQSYHSSNSSLGSVDPESPLQINAHEMLANGVPDSEVLRLWLCELRFEEYYEKFLTAGYDLPTISRMTPEDLNAIGITKPTHRKKLKSEISKLNISDALPMFVPSHLEEWLSLLRLEEYCEILKQQNYNTVQQMIQLTWEDLEEIGITKLGHQKKVMLAIKRIKDIMAGKKISPTTDDRFFNSNIYARLSPSNVGAGFPVQDPRLLFSGYPGLYNDATILNYYRNPYQRNVQRPATSHASSLRYNINNSSTRVRNSSVGAEPLNEEPTIQTVHYRPDVLAVNSGRLKSQTTENSVYGTSHRFYRPAEGLLCPPGLPYNTLRPLAFAQNSVCPPRSFDDGDITPTNEMAMLAFNYEGGGTLPRHRNANKYRPIAKVTAKTRVEVHEIPPQFKNENLVKTTLNDVPEKTVTDSENITPTPTPQPTPKKLPPPPPRRSQSLVESNRKELIQCPQNNKNGFSYINVKNTLKPDMTCDLPPPPAPQDKGNHQHLHSEEFPPPPPELTCISATQHAINPTHTLTSSQDYCTVEMGPNFNQDLEINHFRHRSIESNASFKSTSSSDSGESLPFANDNAGTIKQRTLKPSLQTSLQTSSNSSLQAAVQPSNHSALQTQPDNFSLQSTVQHSNYSTIQSNLQSSHNFQHSNNSSLQSTVQPSSHSSIYSNIQPNHFAYHCTQSSKNVPYQPAQYSSYQPLHYSNQPFLQKSFPISHQISQIVSHPSSIHHSSPFFGLDSPRASPLSSPAIKRKEGIVLPTIRNCQPRQPVNKYREEELINANREDEPIKKEITSVIDANNMILEHVNDSVKESNNGQFKSVNSESNGQYNLVKSEDHEKLNPVNETNNRKSTPVNETCNGKLFPVNEINNGKLIPINETNNRELIPVNETNNGKRNLIDIAQNDGSLEHCWEYKTVTKSKFVDEPDCPVKILETNMCEETSDVFNDIGSMLANLTSELDAMLEQEMLIKKQKS